MIKFENTEVVGWKHAVRETCSKGFKKTKNGRYRAYVSNHSKSIYLGTYDTSEEAKEAVIDYKIDRFVSEMENYGLNPDDGVVYEEKYVVFDNGMIFNLYGKQMVGGVVRDGYRHGIIGRQNRDYHKVVADCFIPNPKNLRDVNHKNGNKLDNRVENLERVTHSENVIRAYRTGLVKKQLGESHHAHKLTKQNVEYIRSVYSKRDPHYGAVALSNKFGVDRTTILDVVKGKTWRCE